MSRVIIKSIGTSVNDDYPDLATWWNAHKGNLVASGAIVVAELNNELFSSIGASLTMSNTDAITSPYHYYAIRAKDNARFDYRRGNQSGVSVLSDNYVRLRGTGEYNIFCDVPYTKFEGFTIDYTGNATNQNVYGMYLGTNAKLCRIDGVAVNSTYAIIELEAGSANPDIKNCYGIYCIGSGTIIQNSIVNNTSITDPSDATDTGDKNVQANAYGIFANNYNKLYNNLVTNVWAQTLPQIGTAPNYARAYGIFNDATCEISNNFAIWPSAIAPGATANSTCYVANGAIGSNNVSTDNSASVFTSGIINFDPTIHFVNPGTNTAGGNNINYRVKSTSPLIGSGINLSDRGLYWDLEGQPRIGNWDIGPDQLGSGISNWSPRLLLYAQAPLGISNYVFADNFDRITLGSNWFGSDWLLSAGQLIYTNAGTNILTAEVFDYYNQHIEIRAIADGNDALNAQSQGMLIRYVDSGSYLRIEWIPRETFIYLRGYYNGMQYQFDNLDLSTNIFADGIEQRLGVYVLENDVLIFLDGIYKGKFNIASQLTNLKTSNRFGFSYFNAETDPTRYFAVNEVQITNPPLTLFINGSGVVLSDTLALNTISSGSIGGVDLFASGGAALLDLNTTLFVNAVTEIPSSGVDLYTQSFNMSTSGLPLYVKVGEPSGNNINLYLQGHKIFSSQIDAGAIYTDTFNNLSNWTQISGTWNATSNTLSTNTNFVNASIIYNNDIDSYPYKVRAKIRDATAAFPIGGHSAGLFTHYIDSDNYYLMVIERTSASTHNVKFISNVAGNKTTPFSQSTSLRLLASGFYWSVDVLPNNVIKIYQNDELYSSFTLPNSAVLTNNGKAGCGGTLSVRTGTDFSEFSINSLELPFFTQGHIASVSGLNLFLQGQSIPTGELTLHTTSFSTSSNNMPLYVSVISSTGISGNIPLYVTATQNSGIFNNLNLYLKGIDVSGVLSQNIPLYITGPSNGVLNNIIPLYVSGQHLGLQGTIPLYLNNLSITSGISLHTYSSGITPGAVPVTSNIPLYINRNENTTIPLYISGVSSVGISGAINLYLFGVSGLIIETLPMFTSGVSPQNNLLQLYTHGF